jgi:hypothetical protein
VGSNARPLPFLRPRHQPRPHRIQADITHGPKEMSIVQHDRGKAALEQVADPQRFRFCSSQKPRCQVAFSSRKWHLARSSDVNM